MASQTDAPFGPVVDVKPGPPGAEVLVVCEHASNRIPHTLGNLGLPPETRASHIAWDPGALGVAEALAERLGAGLVAGKVSRLVYDCNRPPDAPDAIAVRSEVHDIPGNQGLTGAQRRQRIAAVHDPFRNALAGAIRDGLPALRALVTVHSFTPVYAGVRRSAELGLLHGTDDGLVRAMWAQRPAGLPLRAELNVPYSAIDGVTHTLDAHGPPNGLLSVMLEIRNDLIAAPGAQRDLATRLAPWIRAALGTLARKGAA